MIGGYLNNIEPAVHTFKVRSSSVIDDNRWKYVVQPVAVQLLETDAPVTAAPADEAFFEAWNVYEIANTADLAMGIAVADLPGTFELQAIPTDSIVPGFYTQGEERMAVLLFWPNQFDGDCEEAVP
jgi:hypothetical protein